MAETYSTQLDRVQSAIAKIENGAQSVTFENRQYTRGSLQALYEREKWLRKMVSRETRGGIRVRGATPT
jgi:hypothetical protein